MTTTMPTTTMPMPDAAGVIARRRVHRFAAICLAAAVAAGFTLSAPARAEAQAQSPTDEAEALIREGIELRHQNQDAKALPFFDRAYKLARNPRTAAQLGLVKLALGYWVDGERLLNEALATPDHPWIARNLATLEDSRAKARQNIGEIVVADGPPGAEVFVNGQPAGKLPLADPIRLDKGTVEIQLRAPGYPAASRSLRLIGGAHEVVSFALGRPAGPGGVAPAPALAPPPAFASEPPRDIPIAAPPSTDAGASAGAGVGTTPASADAGSPRVAASSLRVAAWVTAAGAAALLGVGIVETVVAVNKVNEFNDHTSLSPTPEDPNHRAADCAEDNLTTACRSIRDARDRARTIALVGYVSAGALAAASATLFVLSARREADGSRQAFSCAPLATRPGLACRLLF